MSPQTGLHGFWKLNETSGNALDSSGNNRTGTVNSGCHRVGTSLDVEYSINEGNYSPLTKGIDFTTLLKTADNLRFRQNLNSTNYNHDKPVLYDYDLKVSSKWTK